MSNKRCFYEVLGCAREVGADELRKAYKREALKFHPDRNPSDPTAESKFKEVNEAYQVLSDDEKRRMYDQFGHAGLEGAAGGFEAASATSSPTCRTSSRRCSRAAWAASAEPRGQRRGRDLRVQVRLDAQGSGVRLQARGHGARARPLRRLRRHRGEGRHEARAVRPVPRLRAGLERARVRHVHVHVPALSGPGRHHQAALRHLSGHGVVEKPREGHGDLSCRHRRGTAPARSRPGNAGARPRTPRPVISTSRSTSRKTSASSATARTWSRACTCRLPRPPSAARSACQRLEDGGRRRRHARAGDPGRYAVRSGLHAEGPGRAHGSTGEGGDR